MVMPFGLTDDLKKMFDRFLIVTDDMISASISGSPEAKELIALQSAIGMEIVHMLEEKSICPLYLQYAGTVFDIDYRNSRVNVVRWIDMDDLEVMYRQEVEKNLPEGAV